MTESNDTHLDDLELSVRTTNLLRELGAETLGDVLAFEEIVATRLSVMELDALFERLGVEYTGRLRTGESAPVVEASGDVESRWETIRRWLDEHHPLLLDGFRPGATEQMIADAEAALGVQLPNDYRDFVSIHDGQEPDEPMVWTCSLFPLSKLAEERSELECVFDELERPVRGPAPEIRSVEYSRSWIPIGRSARGRDYLCLDLDPAPSGTMGQVILIAVDFDDHEVIAPSFAEFLSVYFEELQTGEIEID